MTSYYKLCKYGCNTKITWNTNASKFVEEDGTVHDRNRCEASRPTQQQPIYRGPDAHLVQQQQQQQQQQPQPHQGPTTTTTRYDTAWLIPKEDWERMQDYIGKIDAQLTRLSEFYDSIMQEIEALRNMAFEQQSYRRHQQKLADAEQQYDQDKESGGLVGEGEQFNP